MRRDTLIVIAAGLLIAGTAHGQDTLKIMSYNLLNYQSSNPSRDQYFRTIVGRAAPDVLVVQEITSQLAVDNFFTNVLQQVFPGEFQRGTFIDGTDTDNAIYYRTAYFTFVSNTRIRTALRDINEFMLYSATAADTIRLYSVHLKASSGTANETLRAAEVDSLRRVTNDLPAGRYFVVLGDFNIYRSGELSYQKLLQDTPADDGEFVDPLSLSGTWNNPSYAPYHTQSPRVRDFGGGATGGMDDRFDLILFSRAVSQPGRIHYLQGSLTPIGNDGLHYNDSINHLPNAAVADSVANALHYASDHLPVSARFIFDAGAVSVSEPAAAFTGFRLYQNYPNPFNPSTNFRFRIGGSASGGGPVSLKIYDVLGREVATLVNDVMQPGNHEITWDAHNQASGIYFCRLYAGDFVQTMKLLLLR